MLLRLLFLGLYQIFKFTDLYSFTNQTELARYFFDDDFRWQDKKKTKRLVHWRAFRPQRKEICLSMYNIDGLTFDNIIEIGNKYVGKYKKAQVAGYAHGTTSYINQFCGSRLDHIMDVLQYQYSDEFIFPMDEKYTTKLWDGDVQWAVTISGDEGEEIEFYPLEKGQ